jgi:hypothetical protein
MQHTPGRLPLGLFALLLCAAGGGSNGAFAQDSISETAPGVTISISQKTPLFPNRVDELRAEAAALRSKASSLRLTAKHLDGTPDDSEDLADKLEDRAEDMEDRADDIDDEIEDILDKHGEYPQHHTVVHKASNDTILVLTRNSARDFLQTIPPKRLGARERGFGGSASFNTAVLQLQMKPVQTLINQYPDLKRLNFPIDSRYETFILAGGMGYGGVGNGIRLGGGGWGGSKTFGATRTLNVSTADSSNQIDSLYKLTVGVGMGGFLLEKAYVIDRLNIMLGGFIGAGGISILSDRSEGKKSLFFEASEGEDDEGDYTAREPDFHAQFMLTELHAGLTYSMLSWLHLGLDGWCPLFFSSSGFRNRFEQPINDGFMSINGGVRVRIVLGNLG